MLGTFTYCNPTKLYFGKGALDSLEGELRRYGKTVMLVYGGGSVKKNGIYDKVVARSKNAAKPWWRTQALCPTPPSKNCTKGAK